MILEEWSKRAKDNDNVKKDTRMTFEQMLQQSHGISLDKGFWAQGNKRNKAEMIALMHSELSELLEAVRLPGTIKSNKIPNYTEEAEELADVIIRALDYAGGWGIDVQGAIEAKLNYNAKRPTKHGKKF